jgi:hypothetical protein
MPRSFVLRTLFITAGLLTAAGLLATASVQSPPGKVLRHIVLYKFKPEITPQQVQEVVEAFSALPRKIGGILAFEHGTNVSRENKSEGFTHSFLVTFVDQDALDKYLMNPAHEEYVKVVRDRREKVVVFDYWTDE